MKILLVGSFWHYSLESSYERAFREIGEKVDTFDWDARAAEQPGASVPILGVLRRNAISRNVGNQFVEAVKKSEPDIILVFKGRFILPETLLNVKRIVGDRPILNFNPDSPWEPDNATRAITASIGIYDLHLTWNEGLLQQFLATGAKRVEYLPFAYDPALHLPAVHEGVSATRPRFDAVFVGTYDRYRDELLGQLRDFKIGIWGNGWTRSRHVPKDWIQSSAIYGEESVRILSEGRVALNLLRRQNADSHNMRTFEIPASGHTMLTNRTTEQSRFFQEGIEILCFDSPEELRRILKQIIEGPENFDLGRSAFERVREETYSKRARSILSFL